MGPGTEKGTVGGGGELVVFKQGLWFSQCECSEFAKKHHGYVSCEHLGSWVWGVCELCAVFAVLMSVLFVQFHGKPKRISNQKVKERTSMIKNTIKG